MSTSPNVLFPRVRHQQVAVVVTDFCRVSVYIKFQAGDVADGIPNTDRQASLIVSRVRCVAERIGLRRQLVTFVVARPCDFSVLIRGRELIAVDIERTRSR